ncbi:2-polyprenyl-6-methoxyphenol hydroxylase-like FAD-dependent oxidoreductase [Plantactinospora soyae]|uniref:2-polyprenyl-6-methoxyphenol hydroxylase-like FAD-dependent oxidoreductase n=2 Tax=Plantactinospora soyae TaxID=1544732 RepID=A0A927MCK6_9ACTN|nr:2-polyprenyl-6-methoxyphenol hydroxylase-like FAD-dependent oxidoreductase [Plantactinospora soyae]
MAAAIRLHEAGWETVIVERSVARRSGGYFVLVYGAGVAAAERLGIGDAVPTLQYEDQKTNEVLGSGRRMPGLGFEALARPPRMMLRGHVETALFEALPAQTQVRYSTTPTAIGQDEYGATVTLRNTETGAESTEAFDLVVGADGVRSTVRSLVFGPHQQFLRPTGYMTAAALMREQVPGFLPHEGLAYTAPGRCAWTFPMVGESAPSIMFSYRTKNIDAEFRRSPAESLRRAFGRTSLGPVLGHMLHEYERADTVLFDSADEVVMPRWHNGRVVLLGDAAACPTLFVGMGVSSALAGADLLGTMLEQHPTSLTRALFAWEARLRPFVEEQQSSLPLTQKLFLPPTLIDRVFRLLMFVPLPAIGSIADWNIKRSPIFSKKDLDISAA